MMGLLDKLYIYKYIPLSLGIANRRKWNSWRTTSCLRETGFVSCLPFFSFSHYRFRRESKYQGQFSIFEASKCKFFFPPVNYEYISGLLSPVLRFFYFNRDFHEENSTARGVSLSYITIYFACSGPV